MRLPLRVVAAFLASSPFVMLACGSTADPAASTAGTGGGTGGGSDAATSIPTTSGTSTTDGGGLSDQDAATSTPQPTGAACTADDQCASGGCDDTGHCAAGRSCTQLHGGRTCGPKGDQSCCEAIPMNMAGTAVTLDKYNVTAGRMRAFVEKTKGDVRGYVQAHRPDWFDAAWLSWLPNVMDDGTKVTGTSHVFPDGKGRDGVYQQLGPIHWGTEGPGNEGCLTKQIGNARTYRLPDDVNTTDFNDVQQYDQDVLDEKPVQCLTYFMAAAFCIWDGGRMPTLKELDYAFDGGAPTTHLYPWGMTPVPGGWDDAYPKLPVGYGSPKPTGSDMTYANYLYNWWSPATIKCRAGDQCDYSVYVAPPGRFPKGNGPFGHSDLVGNVYQMAQPNTAPAPGADGATLMVAYSRTGAFDGHAIPSQHPIPGDRAWLATKKYLAVGARCAR